MKKTVTAWSVLLMLVVILAACGGSNNAANNHAANDNQGQSSSSNQGNQENEAPSITLKMGTSADYPPYEDIDLATDEIVGFDVDIAHYIGEQLGFEVEIVNSDFKGLIGSLQSGRVDFVMAGMTPTPEREENADFSDMYFEAKNTIVSKAETGYSSLEELKGKVVGVQLGSTQDEAVSKVEGIEITRLNKIPEILQQVKVGRLDAAIIEDTVIKKYAAQNDDLVYEEIAVEGLSGSAIAFPKGSEWTAKFNEVLKDMQENGKMDELVVKWFEK
ncbi:transporter substrate-binding domain-containing protein [Marinicrinis sediminis]|uniref:Transporter substrate-binding domain-containing protein n=1 Tax=Marinicrinis sediminis TaxID=1652465 RepID=A0ABW5R5R2_9BACL